MDVSVYLTRLHDLSESFLHNCSSAVYVLLFSFQGLKFTQHILIGVLQTLARKYHRETYIKPDKRAIQTKRGIDGDEREEERWIEPDTENKRPTLIRQKQTMTYKDNGEERTGLI